jgi:prepilin-type N-terminal cleavage/methylation domain-containing protein
MKRTSFTLIEMLVVLVITGMLLALAIPVFERLAVGSGVDAAARTVGAQLRLTRQYAIANRKRTALLMPRDYTTTPVNGQDPALMFSAVRPCEVRRNGANEEFVAWIPGTDWVFMPTGSVIAEADQDAGYDGTDGTFTVVRGVKFMHPTTRATVTADCRAIVFKVSGTMPDLQRYVTIIEGFYTGGSSPTIRNADNRVTIEIDQYTGRISYRQP